MGSVEGPGERRRSRGSDWSAARGHAEWIKRHFQQPDGKQRIWTAASRVAYDGESECRQRQQSTSGADAAGTNAAVRNEHASACVVSSVQLILRQGKPGPGV